MKKEMARFFFPPLSLSDSHKSLELNFSAEDSCICPKTSHHFFFKFACWSAHMIYEFAQHTHKTQLKSDPFQRNELRWKAT